MKRTKAPLLEAVFEHTATMMSEALERGTLAWPLPAPPLIASFPPLMPNAPADVTTSALCCCRRTEDLRAPLGRGRRPRRARPHEPVR